MREELFGFKSLRSKRHRIIYNIDEEGKFLQAYHIGSSRDVYEKFQRLLRELHQSSSKD